MNRAQKAAEYHQKGYNCAQAIVCAFCDKVGLDEKTAFKVSEGLGLGVSDTYGTCGAVTGMHLLWVWLIVVGILKYQLQKRLLIRKYEN